MKKVFRGDNSTVAHYWANKIQSEASNGSNFFYENDIIYSYGRHFQIAKHVINENRDRAVLFTQQTYSNTTAKHISIVKQACNHLNVIYCKSPDSTHDANFAHWLSMAEGIAAKLLKATKPEKYLNELNSVRGYTEKYATFWGLTIPITLRSVLDIENKEQYKNYSDNKQAVLKAEEKARKTREKKEHAKQLKKWLSGETNRLYSRNDRDYLRMNENGEIETTQGVKVGLVQARIFWKLIKDGKLSVGDNIAQYTVDSIGDNIKIGCHTFPTDYLIKFGEKHLWKQSA